MRCRHSLSAERTTSTPASAILPDVRRGFRLVLFLALAAFACNAFSGIDEIEVDPCAGGACATDGAAADGQTTSDDGAKPDDANAPDAGDAGGLPVFCEGLSLYLPFDGTATTVQG